MPRKAEPIRDRIARHVAVDDESGCWVWQGAKNAAGYGRMAVNNGRFGGIRMQAHRVAYEEYVGPIPEGLDLDHLCRNRACVNPEHLEPVTRGENIRRGEAPSAKFYGVTHCIHGHEFTPENTYQTARGRYCRACRARRNRESQARKRARANG